MTMTAEMTNETLLRYLIESYSVPEEARIPHKAGYFEGTLLTLMDRFPEVRQEIEDRIDFRRNQNGVR